MPFRRLLVGMARAEHGGLVEGPARDLKRQRHYWLLSTNGGANYDILAYTQNISLLTPIKAYPYTFPHPTANVVARVSG